MSDLIFSIITGLSIGFLGSFHCIGMCGPIALTLPVHHFTNRQKYLSIFLYNIGRALTYAGLGLIFGFLGNQFRFWGLQQAVSIGAGIFLLVFIFSSLSVSSRIPLVQKFNNRVQTGLGKLLAAVNSPASLFSVGLLNGLLPCGLVYVGITASLATMNAGYGALLMFTFGIGTIPVMAGLMLFGHLVSFRIRQRLNKAVPYVVGLMAIILIIRGMNLGVPFLSPKMAKESAKIETCH